MNLSRLDGHDTRSGSNTGNRARGHICATVELSRGWWVSVREVLGGAMDPNRTIGFFAATNKRAIGGSEAGGLSLKSGSMTKAHPSRTRSPTHRHHSRAFDAGNFLCIAAGSFDACGRNSRPRW